MKRLVVQLLALSFIPVVFANTPHPEGLPSKWLDRKADELVEAYGEADAILDTAFRGIVVYGDTPTVMYVYTANPEYGSNCIAAYVVELETERILRYQCR